MGKLKKEVGEEEEKETMGKILKEIKLVKEWKETIGEDQIEN